MKKTMLSLVLVLTLAIGCCVSANAANYIPDNVTYQNLNGQQLGIKTFTLLPDENPEDLIEQDYEFDGFLYSYTSIVKEEQPFREERQQRETVTVTTESKNLEDILEALAPTMDFDDGSASGVLYLDHNSIKTEAAGYQNYSYTVTATKNYTGLDRNDTSYIDKTFVKDGRTLSLANVTWTVESTALVGEELIPATYAATATYSGTAYNSKATGYITTADYTGTVTASGIASIRYTVTYLGKEIVTEEPIEELTKGHIEEPAGEPIENEPTDAKPNALLVIVGILMLILIGLLLYCLLCRKNTTVYEATGKGNEYSKCGQLNLNVRRPELKIDRLKTVPEGMIAVEIDEKTAKQLFGQNISIRYFDTTLTHTVGTTNGAYWFKVDLNSAANAGEVRA